MQDTQVGSECSINGMVWVDGARQSVHTRAHAPCIEITGFNVANVEPRVARPACLGFPSFVFTISVGRL